MRQPRQKVSVDPVLGHAANPRLVTLSFRNFRAEAMGGRAKAAREGLAISFRLRCPSTRASILRQNVNLAKLLLNPLDALGAERVRTTVLPARYGPPAVFSRYDRNGNGRCAVATRPQLFRKNPNQISARNLGFSHAPPPRCFRGA